MTCKRLSHGGNATKRGKVMIVETVVDYEAMSNIGASAIYCAVMSRISRGKRFNLGLATDKITL